MEHHPQPERTRLSFWLRLSLPILIAVAILVFGIVPQLPASAHLWEPHQPANQQALPDEDATNTAVAQTSTVEAATAVIVGKTATSLAKTETAVPKTETAIARTETAVAGGITSTAEITPTVTVPTSATATIDPLLLLQTIKELLEEIKELRKAPGDLPAIPGRG